jgi:hypothetical protein
LAKASISRAERQRLQKSFTRDPLLRLNRGLRRMTLAKKRAEVQPVAPVWQPRQVWHSRQNEAPLAPLGLQLWYTF